MSKNQNMEEILSTIENGVLEQINQYCIQSLDPETFLKWEEVRSVLRENRKGLKK